MTSDAPDPGLTDEQYRGLYEGFYVRAGSDHSRVPWVTLRPHPALVDWLRDHPPAFPDAPALVVGCGLGDDAEHVAARGYAVTAFDFSPTAIRQTRDRFADSRVDYLVADLFDLPERWSGAFDLVVEIRTLQSMPADRRAQAIAAIAGTVAPGGTLFVHTFGAEAGERFDGPPWPVTPEQLAGFTDAGLARIEYTSEPASDRAWSATAVYRRVAH